MQSRSPDEQLVETGLVRWNAIFDAYGAADVREIRDNAPADLPIDWSSVTSDLVAEARSLIGELCIRVVVLELNCARMLDQLPGTTPQARVEAFLQRFDSNSAWEALFTEYPLLRSGLERARQRFRANTHKVLSRLARDHAALKSLGLASSTTPLMRMRGSLSDLHRGGQSVWRLSFADSSSVMYKPKPLAVDILFQTVLAHCNRAITRGELELPTFRELAVADRGDYGWMEYVAPGACNDSESVRRFYLRQGAMLAVFHVLVAVDMHRENMIAHGEYPMAVDLETLFHPYPKWNMRGARHEAQRTLDQSAIRVGMLPWHVDAGRGNGGVNFGAIGDGRSRQFAGTFWSSLDRDDARLESRQFTMQAAESVPHIGSTPVPHYEHTEEIADGFRVMLEYIARDRESWLQACGLLDRFADTPVRYVLRATQTYAKLIKCLTHPDSLRDPKQFASALDVLGEMQSSVPLEGLLRAAENRDLADGDVPYFWGLPSSRDILDSNGTRAIGVLEESGLSIARGRIERLCDGEIANQVWLVRAALAADRIGRNQPCAELAADVRAPERSHHSREVGVAAALAQRISDRALRSPSGITWLGVQCANREFFSIAPVGSDLYDGLAGIALFFAQIGRAARESRFLELAEATASTLCDEIEHEDPTPGGFVGTAGRLYALAHVAAVLDQRALLLRVLEPTLDRLMPVLAESSEVDVMYGVSGAALALVAVHEYEPSDAILAAVRVCFGVIERAAISDADDVGWMCSATSSRLLGFSHGAAGIAFALARLGRTLPLDSSMAVRCDALIRGALRFERRLFDRAARNWPDLRPIAKGHMQAAWCHGAPGIVLGRLGIDADDETAREIEIGVTTTFETWPTVAAADHGLCHGAVGNLVIAARAAQQLGRRDWSDAIAKRIPTLLAQIEHGPLVDGISGEAVFGLMLGQAGIGHGMLALGDPTLPSVLAFDPPRYPLR
jgi:type 2 lantibiotic biosynthesis protein LanM